MDHTSRFCLCGTSGYDAAGDITNDDKNEYLYNADGKICAVEWTYNSITVMTGYIYDAEGNRVAKGAITTMSCDPSANGFTTQADYVLDQAGHQLSEFVPGQGGAMAWQHTNIYASGELIATDDTTETHYYLNDWLGNRRVQTDYEGVVVEQTCASLPYGDGETCAPTPTENLFTGKERDSESGNDYFGARYYSSSMGRWLSPDESLDGAIMELPQTWNKYSYEYNRPLYGTDPDGRCPPCIGAIIGGVVEGGFDLGKQFVNHGYSFSGTNWREVGANALGGAVAGAIAGATGGASLVLDAAAGATGNIAGGIVTRAANGDNANQVLSAGAVADDAVSGFVGGGAGHIAGDFVHIPDEPTFHFNGRNGRYYNQAYRSGLRGLRGRNTQAFINQGVRAGISSSAATHSTSTLWNWMEQWFFNQSPQPPPQPHVTVQIIGCQDMNGNPCDE